jgi:rod shape-determining protein MreC
MSRAADSPSTRRDNLIFLSCVGLAVGAMLLPTAWTQAFATAARETALLPIIRLQQLAEEGRTSRARFQAALAERDSAAFRAQAVPALEAENQRLRALLGLQSRVGGTFLAAGVLHQPTPGDGRTLLLASGAREGVRIFVPVVAPAGLVGVIARVGPATSIANTWAHPEFRAAAVTEDGAVLGIVAPTGSEDPSLAGLEFRGVAYRDTVPDGTLVMTSGLGGVFPRGIPIGRVSGVRREELGWERVYRLIPLANPGVVEHVLLLLVPAASANSAADSTP